MPSAAGIVFFWTGVIMPVRIISFFCATLFLCFLSCNDSGTGADAARTGVHADTTYMEHTEGSLLRGQQIFRQRCERCHGLNGNYRNNNAADLQLSRLDSIGIVTTIINGRGAMPLFDHAIPDSDLGQLEQYVQSLRKY